LWRSVSKIWTILTYVRITFEGLVLGLRNLLLLPQLPQTMMLASKVVKRDLKITILLYVSLNSCHTLYIIVELLKCLVTKIYVTNNPPFKCNLILHPSTSKYTDWSVLDPNYGNFSWDLNVTYEILDFIFDIWIQIKY